MEIDESYDMGKQYLHFFYLPEGKEVSFKGKKSAQEELSYRTGGQVIPT